MAAQSSSNADRYNSELYHAIKLYYQYDHLFYTAVPYPYHTHTHTHTLGPGYDTHTHPWLGMIPIPYPYHTHTHIKKYLLFRKIVLLIEIKEYEISY